MSRLQNVVHALFFYPRGGSAQVIRYLCAAINRHELRTKVISGSAGSAADETHAQTFFKGLDVYSVDYTPALEAAEEGEDALSQPMPLHPSYEDRSGAPDRIFTSVSPEITRHIESAWTARLSELLQTPADLFHVHHLTPLQPAFRVNCPDIPLIGHLHGTELKMLEEIERREALARRLGLELELIDVENLDLDRLDTSNLNSMDLETLRTTRWNRYRFVGYWKRRLHQYAHQCDHLFTLTEEARRAAAARFELDPEKITAVPNGVDTNLFYPQMIEPAERVARWRKWLVEDPRGWDESIQPGSIRYTADDIERWFLDERGDPTPVLMFVGRFTSMKRVPLLIRAYHRAQQHFTTRAPLVIWGGNPGEWEGEHPATVARDAGVQGVFLVGWRGHEELPAGLNAADVMVAPSTNEPFGQVYIEAMACQVPVIATRSGGPLDFVRDEDPDANGWLVEPDNLDELSDALVEAANNSHERARRGKNALINAVENYSWDHIAATVREVYESVTTNHRPEARSRRL